MSKLLAASISVLAFFALAVWYFAYPAPQTSQSNATSTSIQIATGTPTSEPAPVSTPAAKASGKSASPNTFKSLLTQTGSYQCDYSQVQSTGQSNNVIYIYGGKLRGEFRTSKNGDTIANLVVYDGRYLYSWQEGSSTGTRTVLTSLSQLPLVIPKDLTSGQIHGTNYESVGWNCHTWLTNKSLLTPPSYVTFN